MSTAAVLFYLVMGLLALHLLIDLIERVGAWRRKRAAERILEKVFSVRLTGPAR